VVDRVGGCSPPRCGGRRDGRWDRGEIRLVFIERRGRAVKRAKRNSPTAMAGEFKLDSALDSPPAWGLLEEVAHKRVHRFDNLKQSLQNSLPCRHLNSPSSGWVAVLAAVCRRLVSSALRTDEPAGRLCRISPGSFTCSDRARGYPVQRRPEGRLEGGGPVADLARTGLPWSANARWGRAPDGEAGGRRSSRPLD
jgi:hypothetical protein